MGIALARIITISELYKDVNYLINTQIKYSLVSIRPYQLMDKESTINAKVLYQLDIQQKDDQDSYIRAMRTLLVQQDTYLLSYSYTQLLNFLYKRLIKLILSIVAINKETKLLVEEVLNKLSNVPFRIDKIGPFISVLIRVGAKVESQRYWSLILQFIDIFNYRNLFLILDNQRRDLIKHINNIIFNKQLEVRAKAANILTSIIKASPIAFDIKCQQKLYMVMLKKNY